jgi:molybdenum cofactor synthesis domain-containing protein
VETWWAEVITIGNEIASGRTVNTNAATIARRLTSLGFTVRRITVVRDEIDEIVSAFRESFSRKPKVVISTGGLGPTYDDRTAEGLAIAIGSKLVLNEDALRMIAQKYEKIGAPLTEERKKMAFLPEGAVPVPNEAGIAPGIYLVYGGIEVLATPGVPREMDDVLERFVKGYLKARPNVKYAERSFVVRGIMESAFAPYVKEAVKKFDLYVKTHPKGLEVSNPVLEVQVAGSSSDEAELNRRLNECVEYLKSKAVELGGKIEG